MSASSVAVNPRPTLGPADSNWTQTRHRTVLVAGTPLTPVGYGFFENRYHRFYRDFPPRFDRLVGPCRCLRPPRVHQFHRVWFWFRPLSLVCHRIPSRPRLMVWIPSLRHVRPLMLVLLCRCLDVWTLRSPHRVLFRPHTTIRFRTPPRCSLPGWIRGPRRPRFLFSC